MNGFGGNGTFGREYADNRPHIQESSPLKINS